MSIKANQEGVEKCMVVAVEERKKKMRKEEGEEEEKTEEMRIDIEMGRS